MIRVLLISQVASIGGGERVLLDLARYLPDFGIQAIALCLKSGPLLNEFRKQGTDVYLFEIPRIRRVDRLFSCITFIQKLIHLKNINIVHSNHTAHLVGLPASKLQQVPELWHIHDVAHKKDIVTMILENILPPDHILFTTPEVERGCYNFKKRAKSTAIVYPGIDIENIQRTSINASTVRARYNLPKKGSLCLTVARMQPHKGHRYLIEAVKIICKKTTDIHFAIAGKATGDEEEKYLNHLKLSVARLQLNNNLSFLGFAEEPDLRALMKEASILVHPALTEGFGLVILESMALGTPVIAASADGPRRILKNEQGGLLVPPGNSTALSDAIFRLLNDKKLRSSLNPQQRASQFTSYRMAKETAEFYLSII